MGAVVLVEAASSSAYLLVYVDSNGDLVDFTIVRGVYDNNGCVFSAASIFFIAIGYSFLKSASVYCRRDSLFDG